jgi:hypothetical protein
MTRVLVLTQCSTRDTVVDWQLAPLKSHRLGIFLRSRVTLSFEATRTLEEMVAVARSARCDVLWVASGWSESAAATLEAFKALRDATKAKIVYVDTFDQVSSPFLSILPYVDLYTKKQLIRDRSFYLKPTRAGCPVADYYEREHGVDLGEWSFGSVAPSAAELDKLMLNWNVASAPHLVRRTKRRSISAAELSRRPIDVHYRVGLEPPEAWGRHYNAHRTQVHKALEGMPSTRHVVNVAGKRKAVTPKQFREELANSKLSIGELRHTAQPAAAGRVHALPGRDLGHQDPDQRRAVPPEARGCALRIPGGQASVVVQQWHDRPGHGAAGAGASGAR